MSNRTAGEFTLRLSTNGEPVSADLTHVRPFGQGEKTIRLFGEDDFHDLHYLLTRALAEIADHKERNRARR